MSTLDSSLMRKMIQASIALVILLALLLRSYAGIGKMDDCGEAYHHHEHRMIVSASDIDHDKDISAANAHDDAGKDHGNCNDKCSSGVCAACFSCGAFVLSTEYILFPENGDEIRIIRAGPIKASITPDGILRPPPAYRTA